MTPLHLIELRVLYLMTALRQQDSELGKYTDEAAVEVHNVAQQWSVSTLCKALSESMMAHEAL
jgi:hypothetical protein